MLDFTFVRRRLSAQIAFEIGGEGYGHLWGA